MRDLVDDDDWVFEVNTSELKLELCEAEDFQAISSDSLKLLLLNQKLVVWLKNLFVHVDTNLRYGGNAVEEQTSALKAIDNARNRQQLLTLMKG